MPNERIQRRIDAFLDQAEAASDASDWEEVAAKARAVLAMDPEDEVAPVLLRAAEANLGAPPAVGPQFSRAPGPSDTPAAAAPDSFAGGRYVVRRFLGEGGKKRVYLAHDALLDRDVAFALIKTEGLDEVGRERVVREAQAMGRMGVHPHIVSILDFGDHDGTPYVVTELMGGGDVEGLLEDAEGPLPLGQSLEIAKATADGLVFAHEQGVVHRDLKPGNVWLTADGVAKIGDFGLAVAEGRSRLTQHGMMVGTFGYMPPEQALGQEVTPQADLYSLGAMLYELVTGSPPFVGDDPTAVISQHINTAPVRPSLRSEHCPPELEALILRLLAKAPADRPASAAEVLDALDAVDPAALSASDSQMNPLDRLARGVFVGRESELKRLRSAADDAFAGRGSVVMLVGEPGVGKTRTAQELETYARMRGAQVLWGRAHEASGAPAYWPWVQVGRAWGRANDVQALAEVLESQGAGGGDLARLFPELPGILGQEPQELPPVADESAQFRLFDAYVNFLRAASADSPLVIVLDDIHWADKPTLLLLQHLAREVSNARLLVVGTYRDTELSRTHPLSEALSELNREGGFQRIVLRGLSESEVHSYLAATIGHEPSADLVGRIHDETEGNAFFLSEVVNLLTEEGTLNDSVSDIALPDGVREALGRRLDRLSEEANELLTVSSVVGREFAYETLRLVRSVGDDELLRLVEEGLDARVIEELPQPGRYRFTHALMRETLLDELSTTRRVRLHGEVAEALERQYGDRADQRAPALAVHYAESATLNADHARKAVHYLAVAGRAADQQTAWAEAARLFALAVHLISEAPEGAGAEDEAALPSDLALSASLSADYRTAWRALRRALDLYRERDDGDGFLKAASKDETLQVWAPAARVVAVYLEALELAPDPDSEEATILAVRLNRGEARARVGAERAAAFLQRARTAAPNLSPRVRGEVARTDAMKAFDEGRFSDSVSLHQEADELGDTGEFAGHLLAGDLSDGIEKLTRNLASPIAPAAKHYVSAHLAAVRLLRAEFDEYRTLETEYAPSNNFLWRLLQAEYACMIGDREQAVAALPEPELVGGVGYLRTTMEMRRVGVLWSLGLTEAARSAFEDYRQASADTGVRGLRAGSDVSAEDFVYNSQPHLLDSSAAYLANETEREALVTIIRDQPGGLALRFLRGPYCAQRVYGDWAIALDMLDDAVRLHQDALEWCEQEGCPVEAGRCLQGLAEVAERRGEREQAMEYLDRAGELFSRHGAKLYLDQVLAKKEILRA